MSTRGFVFGALSLLALGCQDNAPVINSERAPILGGAAATAGQFPSVVAVGLTSGQGGLCTGTLVAPDVVLTAAHCIDPGLSGLPSLQAVASSTIVVFNTLNVFGNGGFSVGARQVIQHPQHPDFSNPNTLGQHDVGIILLDTPVNNVTPSPIEFDPNRNLIGTAVTQVGYGLTDATNQNSAGKLFFVGNSVDSCSSFGFSNDALVCMNQQDGKGSCSGDSGGPLFGPNNEVLGVTSFGDQNCAIFGAYTRTSFEADFVAPFIDGTPPDCSANNACNPLCAATPDPDCLNCDSTDNTCTQGCGQNGNPVDDDCNNPCAGGDFCNQQCEFLNQTDPDCEVDKKGCAVTPASTDSRSSSLPIVALFGLFGLGLFISRRTIARR